MNKNFSSTFTSSSNDPVRRGRRNFWQWLVEPVATITEVGERRQASLVSGILLVIPLSMSFGVFVNIVLLHELTTAGILAGSVTVLGVAYILSRTKYYRLSVPLLLAVTALYALLSVSISNNYTSEGLLSILIFNILAILLSSALASFRTTVFLAVANILSILLLPIFIPDILYRNLIIPLIFNGVVSALIMFLTHHRNLMEKDRLSEMDRINSTLQATNTTLNARSSDLNARTRDLNLAAEVGRSISQVRALDVLLTDAAELIRKQFDLYYVQVYLTDPRESYLNLQAGTGQVGKQLMERSHRLPIDTDSINGRAAVEKRSVVISDTVTSAAIGTSARARVLLYTYTKQNNQAIQDNDSSSTFRPNPLLPDTRSEAAVPLMVGEKVVGVLDLQSSQTGALNKDTLSGFEALAGQLAIAIQNVSLLAETNQARAEVEAQARRQTRANWVDYLDAIHQPEETGFVFEQNKITPLTQTREASDNALTAPIAVTGETLGNLIVEMEGGSPIARTEELINTVAQQVARQIESLRLLDSAERYRAEAEQASRRITHEGWQAYAANTDKSLSYVYDLKEVRAQSDDKDRQVEDTGYILPLKVRDETVGKLVVQGLEAGDSESTALVSAVAERLGAHIKSLRLTMQTEQALATTQKQAQREQALRQITSAVRGSTDPTTILRSAARELGTLLGRKTIVRLNTEQPKAIANNGNEPVTPAELQNADGGNK